MTLDGVINVVLVLGVILGGIGYAVGQFTSQRRKGQSEALTVALGEIDALRVRAERQDREVMALRTDVDRLTVENESFRSLLTDGTFLAEQIRTLVADEVERGAHMVIAALGRP